jgi:hypothetical protein
MRLGGRLQAAIEVLSEIDTRHRPVPDALKDWGLSHRFAGSGDRAAISNLVHDALRMKLSHGFIMGGDSPADLAVATLLRQWRISPEELQARLTGIVSLPKFLRRKNSPIAWRATCRRPSRMYAPTSPSGWWARSSGPLATNGKRKPRR